MYGPIEMLTRSARPLAFAAGVFAAGGWAGELAGGCFSSGSFAMNVRVERPHDHRAANIKL